MISSRKNVADNQSITFIQCNVLFQHQQFLESPTIINTAACLHDLPGVKLHSKRFPGNKAKRLSVNKLGMVSLFLFNFVLTEIIFVKYSELKITELTRTYANSCTSIETREDQEVLATTGWINPVCFGRNQCTFSVQQNNSLILTVGSQ